MRNTEMLGEYLKNKENKKQPPVTVRQLFLTSYENISP